MTLTRKSHARLLQKLVWSVETVPIHMSFADMDLSIRQIMVFGEITTRSPLDYQKIIRGTIEKIGYDDSSKGFDHKTCNVLVAIEQQSVDIAQGLDHGDIENHGAGDQGIMFGYASDESKNLMPLTITLAHDLNRAMADARRDGSLAYLRPDSKTQVALHSHQVQSCH